jgi:hypothetical protein
MLNLFLLFVALFYLAIAKNFFKLWLTILKQDSPHLSSEEKFLAIAILSLSTIFWPFVVPIAYLELTSEKLNCPKINHTEV